MHELSICASLAAIVERYADGRAVDIVHVEVGRLRQVVPDTLKFSWEILVFDTPLQGSVLDIHHVDGLLRCRDCGGVTAIDAPVFRCTCGSTAVDVAAGEELLVTSLELAGPRVATPPRC